MLERLGVSMQVVPIALLSQLADLDRLRDDCVESTLHFAQAAQHFAGRSIRGLRHGSGHFARALAELVEAFLQASALRSSLLNALSGRRGQIHTALLGCL